MAPQSNANEPLTGGALLARISESFVRFQREHYGRGPVMAKTYAIDDMIVCVLRESGLTPLERTIMDGGNGGAERVIGMRENFQSLMATEYEAMIEDVTGRKVVAFISQARVDPDITIEMFFLDAPLDVPPALVVA